MKTSTARIRRVNSPLSNRKERLALMAKLSIQRVCLFEDNCYERGIWKLKIKRELRVSVFLVHLRSGSCEYSPLGDL